MSEPKGIISRIEPGSIAADLGLQPGDQIVSINGHVLHDLIDYRFYGSDELLRIVVRRDADPAHGTEQEEAVFEVDREYGVDLGIEFAEPTFDGVRTCANNCSFCFIKGMPKGMRRSLYVKDDDYRLAFLTGNFITLNNLTMEDWYRIQEQRLSPLYVSVHTTNAELRSRLLGNPQATPILPALRFLESMNVKVHAQIVLTPGLNDGPELSRTISDLAGLWPTVRTVGIVPVGLTRFQAQGADAGSGECLRMYRPDEAGPLIDQVEAWQRDFSRRFKVHWVYASDEWYLLADRPVPDTRAYDGFPQIENGIGLVRKLLDNWTRMKRHDTAPPSAQEPMILVCGTLIAPVLTKLAGELAVWLGTTVRVLPVVNDFFGPQVTVSGLLTGQDVRRALEREHPHGRVFLPRSMFNREGDVTLDDMRVADIAAGVQAKITVAGRLSEIAATIRKHG